MILKAFYIYATVITMLVVISLPLLRTVVNNPIIWTIKHSHACTVLHTYVLTVALKVSYAPHHLVIIILLCYQAITELLKLTLLG